MGRARTALTFGLVLLGSISLALGLAALYVDRTVLDEDRFAESTARALHAPAVRREAARRVGAAFVRVDPDLIAARAGIESATEELLATRALDPVLREAAVEVHRLALDDDAGNVFFDVRDAQAVISSLVARRFGVHVPIAEGASLRILGLDGDRIAARMMRVADDVRLGLWLLPLACILLVAVVAVAPAPHRRRALRYSGLAIAVAGGLLIVVDAVARAVLPPRFAEREAVAAALDVFVGPLFWWGLATAAVGAGVAVATSRLADAPDADRLVVVAARAVVRRPDGAAWRLAYLVLGILVGVAAIVAPTTVLRVAVVIVGLLLVFDGLVEVARLAGNLSADDPSARGRSHRGRLVGAVVGVPLLLALPALALVVTREAPAAVDTRACNGARELCHRPLDRVALPAAHNAMSSANASFTDPNQVRTITEQLDAGIRGLLIDSKLARPTTRSSIAVTVLEGKARASAYAQLGPDGVAALRDLVERGLAEPTGPPAPYLCHIVCELGATRMVDALREIRVWLERHPEEVLVIVIEDLLTPEQTERVFRESGLYRLAYTQPPGAPLPTPREMIDAGRRVLVMAEVNGFPGGWYQPGYDALLKETPYANPTVAALASDESCRPNRGREANPLFLVNHWVAVYPPRPSRAAVVNPRAFLLDRLRRCERIRGAFPNLIAVDFASIGDVVDAARTLNGLPATS